MTISVNTYTLREVGFSNEQLKSILSGAAGFNPRIVEMTINSEGYDRISLKEKSLNIGLPASERNVLEEGTVNYLLAQLDEWSGSQNSGNKLTMMAAETIRALLARETAV